MKICIKGGQIEKQENKLKQEKELKGNAKEYTKIIQILKKEQRIM